MSKSRSELAAEITIAAMQPGGQSNLGGWITSPERVADFYDKIFETIVEMDKQERSLLDV